MFNFFKKQKEENPISDIFKDLNTNQKMSIANLLLTIGVCDGNQGNEEKEIQYLNSYVKILDIRSDRSMTYLKTHGHERTIEDLKPLSKSQKEFLVVAAWEMIICDARPNETELQVAINIFGELGISEDEFIGTVEKTQALIKRFMG